MGLGEALMEEQAFRRLPPRLSAPSSTRSRRCSSTRARPRSTCPRSRPYLVEDPDPNGPFGAKEVGQGPLLPMMPAVANAVFDALGVRVDEVPVTPEKVLAGAEGARRAAYGPSAFPEIAWPEPLIVPPPWEGGDGNAINEPKRRKRSADATPRSEPAGANAAGVVKP